ncbi:hypothetical protein [Streptomyces armeniacus]|uniref:hypothetical protein n=1 Tax=Streptomyces armeniacus TaxID=83291 RepID=UPI001FE7754C|nr:hypothetical protein [Streptomyces armeniacus]
MATALGAVATGLGTGAAGAYAAPASVTAGATAGVTTGAVAGADTAVAAGPPGSPFAACPARAELPEGADPAAWRCEVMTATGHLTVGRIDVPIAEPMRVTHAEGRIDSEFHQVFGGMAAEPIRVPHTPLSVTPQYAGAFDFHSDDQRMGELDVKFRISGPGWARWRDCSIGNDADAVHLVLKAEGKGGPGKVPHAVDNTFAVPGTSGCGRLGRVLDAALDLPSPAGENRISLEGDRVIRSYTELD